MGSEKSMMDLFSYAVHAVHVSVHFLKEKIPTMNGSFPQAATGWSHNECLKARVSIDHKIIRRIDSP